MDRKWRIWEYLEPTIDKIHSLNMTYGAADNQFRDMGDTNCCCGIDNLPGFNNYWKYQTSTIAQIAKDKGIVTKDDLIGIWTGCKKLKFQDSWLTDINGHQGSFPPKEVVDKVWALDDGRAPSHLVNLEKTYLDGQVVYKYINKLNNLQNQQCRQLSII